MHSFPQRIFQSQKLQDPNSCPAGLVEEGGGSQLDESLR